MADVIVYSFVALAVGWWLRGFTGGPPRLVRDDPDEGRLRAMRRIMEEDDS